MAELLVNRENHIVIRGFMVTDLKLKGNELIIYALIYGFSQNLKNQRFNGSLQYMAERTNSTKRSVMNNLKSLEAKGYIGRQDNILRGINFTEYYVTNFTGMEKFSNQSEKSSPNNIEHNIDKERNNNNSIIVKKEVQFRPPTEQEVRAYCLERHNNVDAETFISFYQSNGWKVGKNKMKDWKASVRTWEKNSKFQKLERKSGNIFLDIAKDEGLF